MSEIKPRIIRGEPMCGGPCEYCQPANEDTLTCDITHMPCLAGSKCWPFIKEQRDQAQAENAELKKRVEELEKELNQYKTFVCICGHIRPISERICTKCGDGGNWPKKWERQSK